MNDLNPNAANATAISRLRCGALFFMAILLMVSVRAGLSQTNITGARPALGGQSAIDPQHQSLDYGSDQASGGFDSMMLERRMKLLNSERHKSLMSDTDKLFKLATELNNEIAHSNSGELTPEQLRKVAEIEKLAHGVRDKMTMTLTVPAPSLNFPVYGQPFSQ